MLRRKTSIMIFVLMICGTKITSAQFNNQTTISTQPKIVSWNEGIKGRFPTSLKISKRISGLSGRFKRLSDDKTYMFIVKSVKESRKEKRQRKSSESDVPEKLNLSEELFSSTGVKLFYHAGSPDPRDYFEMVEIETGIFAYLSSSMIRNHGPHLQAERKVLDLFAKEKEVLNNWNIYEAQLKVDRIFTRLRLNANK